MWHALLQNTCILVLLNGPRFEILSFGIYFLLFFFLLLKARVFFLRFRQRFASFNGNSIITFGDSSLTTNTHTFIVKHSVFHKDCFETCVIVNAFVYHSVLIGLVIIVFIVVKVYVHCHDVGVLAWNVGTMESWTAFLHLTNWKENVTQSQSYYDFCGVNWDYLKDI